MVIFRSYVNVYQRVRCPSRLIAIYYHDIFTIYPPMIFPLRVHFCDIPMTFHITFPWYSHDISKIPIKKATFLAMSIPKRFAPYIPFTFSPDDPMKSQSIRYLWVIPSHFNETWKRWTWREPISSSIPGQCWRNMAGSHGPLISNGSLVVEPYPSEKD